ncbi:MAG: lytic transglycosylase protein [Campylobacterota bacterium]|nr:lytic transglycosylase protein [Campylobacterota bacterium]
MIRILFFFLIFFLSLNASLYDEVVSQKRDTAVLKSFDIDESFLKDKELQRVINNYKYNDSSIFIEILSSANIYFPLIKQMLAEEGLPENLVYVAMAESGFKTRAYSIAKAVGIWQFMPTTAENFGLEVDLYVDERRDPIKSTKAAMAYLKHLYGIFGKWYLAVIAYNCGETRVIKAIKEAKSDKLEDLLKLKDNTRMQYLPAETRRYIRKIIAMSSMGQTENLMALTGNMHLLNMGQSYPMATVTVGAGTTLKEVSESIGVDYSELKSLNAALNHGFVPPYIDKFDIYIPYDKVAVFKENFTRKNPDEKYLVYVVKKGDTLSSIGDKYKINRKVIQDFNKLKTASLSPNQKLIIPIERSNDYEYVVQRGDTLNSIATKFDINVKELMDINDKKTTINAGEKIIIQK